MEVLVAEYAGFCYGVKRALGLVEEALEAGEGPVATLGPLIHNRQVVEKLKERGLSEVEAPSQAEHGTLVIRSHGVGPQVLEEAQEAGLRLLDATCTFVKRAQQAARDFVEQGYETFIVGEADHPEVLAIVAWTQGKARVFDPSREPPVPQGNRMAIVAQTTQHLGALQEAASYLLNYARELHIANTVCGATTNRQQAAEKLARQVDVLVLPSRRRPNWTEQFGRVLIEAMACQVAVVGAAVGEIPYVIGDAGLTFSEGDVEALRDRLSWLLQDPAQRHALGRAGRARVLAHYTQARVAQATVEVYRRLMA